jgi:hypothetical protein
MNERDLRDCFAMFAMCGVIMRGDTWTPRQIWELADDMLEARTPKEVGIKTVKRTRKTND